MSEGELSSPRSAPAFPTAPKGKGKAAPMKRPLISAKARTPAARPEAKSTPTVTVASLTLPDLERYAAAWLQDGRLRQHSTETYAIRRLVADKLLLGDAWTPCRCSSFVMRR